VSAEAAWIDAEKWDACADIELQLEPGDMITLGFDGSLTDDTTALVACRVNDGALFLLGLWVPVNGEMIDQSEVDLLVDDVFDRYNVTRFYADPPRWGEWVAKWSSEHPGVVAEWWTNRMTQMSRALDDFHTEVAAGTLKHDGNIDLGLHVKNCAKSTQRGMTVVRKETRWSPKKIDAAIAAVLAVEAKNDAIQSGVLLAGRSRRAFGF
jgi:phage terminase large subunit-like protein